jgi:hypothetical protein
VTTNLAVILTTRAAESRAVLDLLDGPAGGPPDHREERGTLYEIGTFTGGRSGWTVAVAEIGTGSTTAAVAVERAQAAFHPDVVMLVGVVEGADPGDVVVAESVSDGCRPRPSERLLHYARAVIRHGRWQHRAPTTRLLPTPRALVRPVAGDAEGAGFLHGASLDATAEALLVRGICGTDPAGDRFWRPVAARHASAFAVAVLDGVGRPDPQPRARAMTSSVVSGLLG